VTPSSCSFGSSRAGHAHGSRSNHPREQVESFIEDLLARWKPATANTQYRSLQAFWKWAVAESEVSESPMRNMRPPKIPEDSPAILSEEDPRALLKACEGREFQDL
jgi:integrase/recombinase XerC